MIEGRRRTQEIVNYFRKHLKGCETMELAATGALLGVRESRRIVGEYELTGDDLHDRREFPDTIGVYCKFVDIHLYDPPEPGAATTGDAGKAMTVATQARRAFFDPLRRAGAAGLEEPLGGRPLPECATWSPTARPAANRIAR